MQDVVVLLSRVLALSSDYDALVVIHVGRNAAAHLAEGVHACRLLLTLILLI